MHNPDLMQAKKPWWREPWPWFLLALPLSAVVGGLITVWIAAREPDALVSEDYYKEGMAVYQVLEREARARALGVRATLHVRDGRLWVELGGDLGAPPARLNLYITHPTLATQDTVISLVREPAGRYVAVLPDFDSAGRRRLRLEPEDRTWRLNGQWTAPFSGTLQLLSEP